MRLALTLMLLAWALAPSAPAHAQDDEERLYCVSQCVDRSITGMCRRYGRDFCTPYPETACVPHCVERSINGQCRRLGPDFCGLEPECQPYCEERSVTGMCLRYGQDACFSY